MRPFAVLRTVSPIAILVGAAGLVTLQAGCRATDAHAKPPTVSDPEFRAVFVSSAYNLDWPYRMNLHSSEQISEIHAIVDRAKELNFNVIILQVRAFGDRMHKDSTLATPEPWSPALNHGHDPEYDPLSEWVRACHDQGIELHAWVNPFRVDRLISAPQGGTLPVFQNPDDGNHLYLDPGKRSVQDYVLTVIDDLIRWKAKLTMPTPYAVPGASSVRRGGGGGGIDGLLFDHYLPPGPGGGTTRPVMLSAMTTKPATRVDWLSRKAARDPVRNDRDAKLDGFIRKVYEHADAAGIKFGISPDCNDQRAQFWFNNGWCHYAIPESYAEIDASKPNDFVSLLEPWLAGAQIPNHILVAGLMVARTQKPDANGKLWKASEFKRQIKIARELHGKQGRKAMGQAHYSWGSLRSPAQGGPRAPYDIGENLKIPGNNNDDYAESVPVPLCRPPRR